MLHALKKKIDWSIFFGILPLVFLSLSVMYSFGVSQENTLFEKQVLWFILAFFVFFSVALSDISFITTSRNVSLFYGISVFLLIALFFVGTKVNGARSWISLAGFTFQPADFAKLTLILILSKYLAKRHIEIKALKHIFITGIYFFIPFLLIFLQPDFGSALILLGIWFGIILISGLSKKHFFSLVAIGLVSFFLLWQFVFQDYQKKRILTFIHPLADTQGAGYNANQSVIAVGSGKFFGKGVGNGTQSRLSFLPESETDFVFAAIAEEWGFIGSMIVLLSFFFILFRILSYAKHMGNNMGRIFAYGVIFYFLTHFVINVGMNIGMMPVTGVTLPFLSYGGSHLIIEFLVLGILMQMRRKKKFVYEERVSDAFLR